MGRVIHFEIHSDDPERAARFYSRVFGWNIYKWEGDIEYYLVDTGSNEEPGIDGGILRRKEKLEGNAINAFVCTIKVEDIDSTLLKIIEEKGQVLVGKTKIEGVGYSAYCRDTENNIFAIFQPFQENQ